MDPREYAERMLQDLLGADSVLPEQFWGSRQRSSERCGERALMWAVFADGIDRYRRHAHSPAQRAEFGEAERWVFSTDWNWPFSFVNLCEAFDFDPEGVRRALTRWKNQRQSGVRRQRFRPANLNAA